MTTYRVVGVQLDGGPGGPIVVVNPGHPVTIAAGLNRRQAKETAQWSRSHFVNMTSVTVEKEES